MSISTGVIDQSNPAHDLYRVTFFDEHIETLVTYAAGSVDAWIQNAEHIHAQTLNRVIVGLDVEWRPSFNRNIENPVATLQLCVGSRCLIFQLLHAPAVPASLIAFLGNPRYTFVGVGIEADVEKLVEDHGLSVPNAVDLRLLAADVLNNKELRNAGLKQLALVVLGKEIQKPRRVTMSRWDNPWLSTDQVQYACVDALLSFKIGAALMGSGS